MRRSWRRVPTWLAACSVGVLLSLAPTASPAGAAAAAVVYHVSATGSDAGNGSHASPWRTIAKATSSAPAGAVIVVGTGTYAPFTVTKAGQTVTAAPEASVVVQGRAGVQDVVRIAAPAATVKDLTVKGCVPHPNPAGGFNDNGSSAVRIHDGAHGVTVAGLRIRDSRGTNSHGLRFGCYGILAHGANASKIVDNDIAGTGSGIYVMGGGAGTLVADNRIHDNDVLIRNTPGNDDDYGANGISFSNVRSLPGPVVTRNIIKGNFGPSSDYGFDGGAVEIFNSSHVSVLANTIADNENVLETGNSPNGRNLLGECIGNVFAGNTVSGRAPGSKLDRSIGMILRCATGMVVKGNSFTGIDWWVYEITTGDKFASNVNGLTITGNSVIADQKVYALGVDPFATALVLDANRIRHTGKIFANHADGSTSPDLADWQRRTLRDLTSSSL